jgi:hypothetical protein
METAKIDIRKLQLLNDRINQCLDALNQVRLSVHGLSHASAPGINPNVAAVAGLGQQSGPFGIAGQQLQNPQFQQFQPGFQGGFTGTVPGTIPGLSHSTAGIGANPFAQQLGFGAFGQQQPWINPLALAALGQAQSQVGSPYGTSYGQFGGGLSHTGAAGAVGSEWTTAASTADPYFLMRVVQTFPYVQMPVPPVVSLY